MTSVVTGLTKAMHEATATVVDEHKGIAEIVVAGYGNTDLMGDIIVKGAAANQIAGVYGNTMPLGLLDHDRTSKAAVAKTLDMRETDEGLVVLAQFNLTKAAGREAFDHLLFYGDEAKFSIGFQILKAREPNDREKALGAKRVITEIKVAEWSIVSFPANDRTRLVSVKGAPDEWTPGHIDIANADIRLLLGLLRD